MPGWAWAVIAGASFGISQLSNRGLNREMDALRATTAMVTALLAGLIAASAITGAFSHLADITAIAVFWFALAALLHFLAGWTLFAFSQQQIGPSRTAAILSVNPVMAAVVAWLVLSEELRPITWVGVLAVTAGVGIVATARLTGGAWSNPSLALVATVFFSVSPLFVRWGLDEFDHPLLGLTVGMAITVPAMHLSSRVFTGMWVSVPKGTHRWLFSGGLAAAVALTAQWSAFALIPVGAAISLQQLNTPLVLFAGPILLATPSERATPRLIGGTVLIIAGAVLVALFGRSL